MTLWRRRPQSRLHFRFGVVDVHTVEVMGSSPVVPTAKSLLDGTKAPLRRSLRCSRCTPGAQDSAAPANPKRHEMHVNLRVVQIRYLEVQIPDFSAVSTDGAMDESLRGAE
jgi:hypothetical protein